MRNRFLQIGSALLASLAVTFCSTSAIYAATGRAGVNAALADCLEESRLAAGSVSVTGAEKNTAGSTEDKSDKDDKSSKADSDHKDNNKDKKEEKKKADTICGYTNLGIANVDNYLNVRSEAKEDAKIIGKLPADAGCEIIGKEGDWYHITSGKVGGYVKSEFITTGSEAKKQAEKLKKRTATVNTMTVYIREKPNTDCTILSIVTEDEELEVLKEGKEWIKVKIDSDQGYVNAKYVQLSDELKKAMPFTPDTYKEGSNSTGSSQGGGQSSVAQTALSYVGGRYVWGGTSLTNGVDCSGFTMQIMAKYGVYLPHLASAQAGYGRSVSTGELQAGDLIFYGSGGYISHVAIYIGGGQIVHASNSRDGIKVSNAFYRTPVCCRRVL